MMAEKLDPNLLEKKVLIDKKEVPEEIKRLKKQPKAIKKHQYFLLVTNGQKIRSSCIFLSEIIFCRIILMQLNYFSDDLFLQ
jgi:hypothetical protein